MRGLCAGDSECLEYSAALGYLLQSGRRFGIEPEKFERELAAFGLAKHHTTIIASFL